MYIRPEFESRRFPSHIRQFISITGWQSWKRRLDWLRRQVRCNTAMAHYLIDRFELELAFSDIYKRRKLTGKYAVKEEVAAEYGFLSFSCMLPLVYGRLNPVGQIRLRGMLFDALKNDYGLGPLAYEIKVATHLMTLGFDVEFSDLEGNANYDFLAKNGDVCIEIECKFISADVGKKIHRKRLFQLGGVLEPKLRQFLGNPGTGLLVRLTLPDRLHGNEQQHVELSDLVCGAIAEKKMTHTYGMNRVAMQEFDIVDSPFRDQNPSKLVEADVEKFLLERFGLDNKNVLAVFGRDQGAIIVVIESAKGDAVLKGIHSQLKRAAKRQFSGSLPAILCCHLADITEGELLSLGNGGENATGLDQMTSDLIISRPQLWCVAYTASGSIQQRRVDDGVLSQTMLREQGPAYAIANPFHPLAGDSRYNIF